jgi:hypothetical protein
MKIDIFTLIFQIIQFPPEHIFLQTMFSDAKFSTVTGRRLVSFRLSESRATSLVAWFAVDTSPSVIRCLDGIK